MKLAARLIKGGRSNFSPANRASSRELIPEGSLVYAIGDIHGRDDLLSRLLLRIEQDAAGYDDQNKIVVFLGDYVDRGLQSRQVLERLTSPFLSTFHKVFLKGNHEEAMLQFLDDSGFGQTWKYYGGAETLHSYGINNLATATSRSEFEGARAAFENAVPQTHREFLRQLPASYTLGECFFAHAGVRPGIPLDQQETHDLLWIRGEFLDFEGSFGKLIVHGHTPGAAPVLRNNRIGIDTGAYMTNVLTALVIHHDGIRILQTRG